MKKKIPMKYAETTLERNALRWLNERGAGYDDGAAGAYKDLEHGGCVSGTVSHLIYYTDTGKFYRRHQKDIDALLKEQLFSSGLSVQELFYGKWDNEDPLGREWLNQNLLAWFGFEEAARIVMDRFTDAEEEAA